MNRDAPIAVLGAPVYSGAAFVESALRSVLAQSRPDFALVVCDDASADGTGDVARRLADADDRAVYLRNEVRLGMVENWRRCFEIGVERWPAAKYFAWVSDHDLWDPDWLAELVDVLEARSDVVLAYPQSIRIDEHGRVIRRPFMFDTTAAPDARARMRALCADTFAGSMVYGLFRKDALAAAGVLRRILVPDQLLMAEMAIHGHIYQVPKVLWQRRFQGIATRSRQRRSLFRGRIPAHAYLPPLVVHTSILVWRYVIRATTTLSRTRATFVVGDFAVGTGKRYLRRRIGRLRKRTARYLRHGRKLEHMLRRRVRMPSRRRA